MKPSLVISRRRLEKSLPGISSLISCLVKVATARYFWSQRKGLTSSTL
jgi:hypothetical protein